MRRKILITGATGKLGTPMVKYFLKSGDDVIALGRRETELELLKDECCNFGSRLHVLKIDLMQANTSKTLTEELELRSLFPCSLVNNARNLGFLKGNSQGQVSTENFLNEFKLGVVVPYELIMALSLQKQTQLKAVVNIGSIYGSVAHYLPLYDNPSEESFINYSVTKAALQHLTKELAVRLSGKKIRINCVALGGVEGRANESFRMKYGKQCPAGRMLNEREIMGPIDTLLSDKTDGVTGHTMMVDGGWTLW